METIKCKFCGKLFRTNIPVKSGYYELECPHCESEIVVRVPAPEEYKILKCSKCGSENRVLMPFKPGMYGIKCRHCNHEFLFRKQ